ncbi:general secretion pathway protein GspC [Bordetella genomosp. 13]|uniref:general secretion pathway protein GspC n=1 Tax=Bordetella genomosp. 13 TaxID=463040 RepID=UPI0021B5A836|nr:general secretion pathway protein GspC [Bordetella genomosp. 13]
MVRHSPNAGFPYMRFTARSFRPTLPGAARLAAILAAAAALGVWGAILLAPSPDRLPPAVAASPVRQSNVDAVALWFGRDGVLQTQITVLGLIAQGANGAAVISVNGGPPAALAVGQTAAPGIVLAGVDSQGVVLDANGTRTRVAAPPYDAAPGGITTVR